MLGENSIAHQIVLLKKQAELDGFDIDGIITEYGTGFYIRKDIIKKINMGKRFRVLCASVDRLGRDFRLLVPVFQAVQKGQVEIITLSYRFRNKPEDLILLYVLSFGPYIDRKNFCKRIKKKILNRRK